MPSLHLQFPCRLIAATGLLVATAFGCSSWFSVYAERASHERLVYALSTSHLPWTTWDFAGTRGAKETLPATGAWLLTVVWAAALASAGHTTDKRLRPLLLLAALAGTVACIGAGDAPMAVVAGLAAAMAAAVLHAGHPEKRRALKVASTGIVATGLATAGIAVLWTATFPDAPRPITGFVVAGLSATVISMLLARRGRLAPGVLAATTAALFAAATYPGAIPASFAEVWRTRGTETAAFIGRRVTHPELSRELAAYRPTPAEAAASRLPRAESGTDASRLPELLRLSQNIPEVRYWLTVDDALYAPRDAAARTRAVRHALTGTPPPSGPAGDAMRGWLLLADARPDEAGRAFREAGEAPMNRLGAGLAAAARGDRPAAVEELVRWCRIEPRAVFSPAWERAPLADLKEETLRRWKAETLAAGDSRAVRFVVWSDAWERSGGDMKKFLTDPANTAPVAPAVKLFRERLLDTLERPDNAKIGTIFSAGVVLFTDRYVNLGQCHRLFDACAGGAKTAAATDRILISRPTLPGWKPLPEDGGAGATPHDFEENLLVRLTTYGLEGDGTSR